VSGPLVVAGHMWVRTGGGGGGGGGCSLSMRTRTLPPHASAGPALSCTSWCAWAPSASWARSSRCVAGRCCVGLSRNV